MFGIFLNSCLAEHLSRLLLLPYLINLTPFNYVENKTEQKMLPLCYYLSLLKRRKILKKKTTTYVTKISSLSLNLLILMDSKG